MPEHTVRFRARFAETDAMQVVYYAEYFVWFEVARTELFRAVGIPYSVVARERGFHSPVVQAHADYKASARYDDEVAVKARTTKVGRSSLQVDYEVRRLPDNEVLCTGHTVHVLVGEDGKAREIPKDMRDKLAP
ncbi:MAG: acyl-CoA thioesterase [Nitrososphaerota archaeon]|nr:acyl-CoA thioesterase [Nitrososphaerota archaeon]MDG6967327.1 acyl-CoA thioesterase [Nitrososphaerota archaeon]MDG6978405.1 acyl-CoA thioesterase [Nitrososphaerota archaeon]MDG7005858.1 acyl-CoA thioesterase [Nitrososphaerota archaeon]MDG7020724.1 acyl-CoA thioesterase [Nitrososphaerota archaeon]